MSRIKANIEWISLADELPAPHMVVLIAYYSSDDYVSVISSWRSESPANEYFPNDPRRPMDWVDGFGVNFLGGKRPHHVKYWAHFPPAPTPSKSEKAE